LERPGQLLDAEAEAQGVALEAQVLELHPLREALARGQDLALRLAVLRVQLQQPDRGLLALDEEEDFPVAGQRVVRGAGGAEQEERAGEYGPGNASHRCSPIHRRSRAGRVRGVTGRARRGSRTACRACGPRGWASCPWAAARC